MSKVSRPYRFWLRVLPAPFRDEFADEMATVFAEQRRRTDGVGVVGLWLTRVAALLALAVRLRLDQIRLDLRDAARGLIRNKTFTLTAIATLALALGPATAVFSVINGVVLDPIPGVDTDRLTYVWSANPERNRHEFPWSELNFSDHRERQRGFAALTAFTATSATFGGETPQQVIGAWVSVDMFRTLGVSPARGRVFEGRDTLPGASPVMILATHSRGSDLATAIRWADGPGRWRDRPDHRRAARGISISVGADQFLAAADRSTAPPARGAADYLSVIGRLAPARRRSDSPWMKQVAVDLEKEYPTGNSGSRSRWCRQRPAHALGTPHRQCARPCRDRASSSWHAPTSRACWWSERRAASGALGAHRARRERGTRFRGNCSPSTPCSRVAATAADWRWPRACCAC